MKPALLAMAAPALMAEVPAVPPPIPSPEPGGLPCDGKDKQPLLLGPATAQAILAHRAVFRDNLAKVKFSAGLRARWKAVKRPFTLVAVFGSWCGDSHLHLPELLALEAEPNPFIEIHYLGVYRDKVLHSGAWPGGCAPQPVLRVPTFYVFALQPGGGQKLVGSVVEHPTKAGQTMGEALVELLEAAGGA